MWIWCFSARPFLVRSCASALELYQGLPQRRRGQRALLGRAELPAGRLAGRGAFTGFTSASSDCAVPFACLPAVSRLRSFSAFPRKARLAGGGPKRGVGVYDGGKGKEEREMKLTGEKKIHICIYIKINRLPSLSEESQQNNHFRLHTRSPVYPSALWVLRAGVLHDNPPSYSHHLPCNSSHTDLSKAMTFSVLPHTMQSPCPSDPIYLNTNIPTTCLLGLHWKSQKSPYGKTYEKNMDVTRLRGEWHSFGKDIWGWGRGRKRENSLIYPYTVEINLKWHILLLKLSFQGLGILAKGHVIHYYFLFCFVF